MPKIRVLHLTWSADAAGMLADLVCAQSHDQGLELDVCFGTRGKGIFAEQMERVGIRPLFIGMGSRYSPMENIKGGRRLRRIIQEGNYDIIHLQEAMLPFPFLSAVRTSPRARIVLHNRGEFHRTETFLQRIGQEVKKKVYRLLVPDNVDRLICNSRYAVGRTPHSPAKHPAKIEILYNAIDLAEIERIRSQKEELRSRIRREQGLPADAFLVTVVARLVAVKRIDRFIDAFGNALFSEPGLTALLVGNGPLYEKLAGRISKSGLQERVRLLGHRRDAKSITAASDLFVLPSTGESFGIAALEAIALEVPVAVFSDAGGPLEFIVDGKNGYVVSDKAALAKCIVACKQKPPAFSPLGTEFNNFGDINNYARRIREIYDELLV